MDQSSTVETIRQFNRFYTNRIGLLDDKALFLGLSLAEARVLFEIAHTSNATAKVISGQLNLDAGYLSRILRNLEKRKLIARSPDPADRRRATLKLLAAGKKLFARLNAQSAQSVENLIEPLSAHEREALAQSMRRVTGLLSAKGARNQIIIRNERIGDIGKVTALQGELYAREFGWDATYEALVAKILSDYAMRQNSERERGWIAERDGEIVGSVYLMEEDRETARLRLLYVDETARGAGLGRKLVRLCAEFAREKGFKRIVLWTQSILSPARSIYASEGYKLVKTERHKSFGHDLEGETWQLDLTGPPATE
jgi:DNA-binding MarR family transcriptional regulator/GNAT superfamily N-acetyltransferase